MGRVQPIPPDIGDPGKFYFCRPEVILIPGKGSTTMSQIHTTVVGDGEPIPSLVRTRSSYEFQGYQPPLNVQYGCGVWPRPVEIKDYLRTHAINGFGEGAVVTRRYQPHGLHKYKYRWGYIILVHGGNGAATPWAPYSVKWFAEGKIEMSWAEDLVLIHPALDDDMIADILESQGVE